MTPSWKQSEKKLACSKKNQISTDFWEYYSQNKEFIENTIACQSSPYRNNFDLDEVRQDVLIKLHNHNVLEQFDSSRSSLSTYLITKIKFYVKHATREQSRWDDRNQSLDDPHQEIPSDSNDLLDQVIFNDHLRRLKATISPELWDYCCMMLQGWRSADIARKKKVSRAHINYNYSSKLKRAYEKLFKKN